MCSFAEVCRYWNRRSHGCIVLDSRVANSCIMLRAKIFVYVVFFGGGRVSGFIVISKSFENELPSTQAVDYLKINHCHYLAKDSLK
jgi:hypothetical protein